MDTSMAIILGGVLVLVVVAMVAAWAMMRSRKTTKLRERFGPEYDEAVTQYGDRSGAESALSDRVERVDQLTLRPLTPEARSAFAQRWERTQARFVDEPVNAVEEADVLVQEVMTARGYPASGFDRNVEDLSVDHPEIVRNYREGHRIYLEGRGGSASTEELRTGFVAYRALFAELLESNRVGEPSRR